MYRLSFIIHKYYRYATDISLDCGAIQFQINTVLYKRLKGRLEKPGSVTWKYIAEHYGKSKMMRYISGEPLRPIGYVKTKNPMHKKKKICNYTAEGREEIHRNLKFDETVMIVPHMLQERICLTEAWNIWIIECRYMLLNSENVPLQAR